MYITLNGNTLCLFQLVEKHGKVLYDRMKGKENVYFVYGGTDTDQREKIRGLVDNIKIIYHHCKLWYFFYWY